MVAGFRAYNDSNIVQLDENYSNHQLRQKIDMSVGPSGGNPAVRDFSFNATPFAVVATRSTVGGAYVVISNVSFNGSTWNYRYQVYNPTGATMLIETYIFDIGFPDPGNHGLAIWKGDGQLAYASAARTLRISGYDGSRKMAIIQNRFGFNKIAGPPIGPGGQPAFWINQLQGFNCAGGFNSTWIPISQSSFGGGSTWGGSIIGADVTDF